MIHRGLFFVLVGVFLFIVSTSAAECGECSYEITIGDENRCAPNLDGLVDYFATGTGVNGNTNIDLKDKSFSVSFWWLRQNVTIAATEGKLMYVLTHGVWNEPRMGLQVGIGSDNRLHFNFYNDDLATVSKFPASDTWEHLAFTYDVQTNVRTIYRNGVGVATDSPTWGAYQGPASPVIIGRQFSNALYSSGGLSDVRVYSRSLSSEDVQGLQSGSEVSAAGLELHLKLDETSGSTATDSSANQLNAAWNFGSFEPRSKPCKYDLKALCENEVQDGNEEGVNCGGSACDPCDVPTCSDCKQNSDETGVDCGGSCDPCPTAVDGNNAPTVTASFSHSLTLGLGHVANVIVRDWFTDADGDQLELCVSGFTWGSYLNFYPQNSNIWGVVNEFDQAVAQDPDRDYNLTITAKDGRGGSITRTVMVIPEEVFPTCEDNVMNGDETGVDCGGNNCAACAPEVQRITSQGCESYNRGLKNCPAEGNVVITLSGSNFVSNMFVDGCVEDVPATNAVADPTRLLTCTLKPFAEGKTNFQPKIRVGTDGAWTIVPIPIASVDNPAPILTELDSVINNSGCQKIGNGLKGCSQGDQVIFKGFNFDVWGATSDICEIEASSQQRQVTHSSSQVAYCTLKGGEGITQVTLKTWVDGQESNGITLGYGNAVAPAPRILSMYGEGCSTDVSSSTTTCSSNADVSLTILGENLMLWGIEEPSICKSGYQALSQGFLCTFAPTDAGSLKVKRLDEQETNTWSFSIAAPGSDNGSNGGSNGGDTDGNNDENNGENGGDDIDSAFTFQISASSVLLCFLSVVVTFWMN